MRVSLALAIIAILGGNAIAAENGNAHPYRKHWKKSLIGKQAVVGTVAGAGISHLANGSKKYGGGAAGFGKHVGLGYATHAVGTTVEHAVAAPLHEDLNYHRSNKHGFGPRLKHALVSTVVVRNTKTGKRRPATGRLSGKAASGAFAATVLPAASGAATAGIGLAAVAGSNVAREFWPEKKHANRARR